MQDLRYPHQKQDDILISLSNDMYRMFNNSQIKTNERLNIFVLSY